MIVIIDNYDSFTYNLYQGFKTFYEDVIVVRNDEISVEKLKTLSPEALVLSPGPGKPEEAGICIEAIKYFSDKIPILGVCLGHQAIACAFGGSVIKASQIMHGKTSLVFHNRGALYKNLSLPFLAGRYHSLMVQRENLPAELIVEAETSDEMIMGMRHRTNPTFGVQFHPESILSEEGMKILENFIQLSKRALLC